MLNTIAESMRGWVAQKGVDSSRELEHLAFDELSLYDKKAFENATILTYEVIS